MGSESYRSELVRLQKDEATLSKELARHQGDAAKARAAANAKRRSAAGSKSASTIATNLRGAEGEDKKAVDAAKKAAAVQDRLAGNASRQRDKQRALDGALKSETASRDRAADARMRKEKDHAREVSRLSAATVHHVYATVEKNVNVSSMCLYSGPLPDRMAHAERYSGTFGKWGCRADGGVGWLATGDADLKDRKRRSAFLHHYRKLLDHVVTLTIPHHGSENNFDPELLTRVAPSFCVAAADAVGKWRHPGTAIVQAVASHGLFLSVVTSATSSRVEESGELY